LVGWFSCHPVIDSIFPPNVTDLQSASYLHLINIKCYLILPPSKKAKQLLRFARVICTRGGVG
jgi:hypothetical protein